MAKILWQTPLGHLVVDAGDAHGFVRVLSVRHRQVSGPLALQTLAEQMTLCPYDGAQHGPLDLLAQLLQSDRASAETSGR